MHTSLPVVLIAVSCAYLCTASYIPKCSPPHAPSYGGYYPRRYSYSVGSKVRFTCKYGYQRYGASYTVCVYDRKTRKAVWKHDTPVCKRKL